MRRNWNPAVLLISFVFLINACASSSSSRYNVRHTLVPDSVLWFDSAWTMAFFRMDTFFANRHQYHEFNGNVMMAVNGRKVYLKSFGTRAPLDSSKLRYFHTFQLASVSKPFTATAVLQLCQAGKLNPDDTITKYIPGFPYKEVTVRQLLCHRSGLPEYFHFADRLWKQNIPDVINNDSVIKLMIDKKPKEYFPAGFKYDYCNTGYVVLSYLIEKISGKSYAEYLRDSIFIPAGMKNSFVWTGHEDSLPGNALHGYEDSIPVTWSQLNQTTGDKGIYSNCNDLLCFDRSLASGKILSGWWQELAYSCMHSDLPDEANYGLGWRITRYNNRKIIYHSGWWKGFRTLFVRDLNKGVTVVVLSNIRCGPYVSVYDVLQLLYSTEDSAEI